jgi:hypothetical protein
MSSSEPRNPFYLLLLLVSFSFVVTALAYAVIPTLEQKAMDLGQSPPATAWRDALRRDGWRWLLWQLGGMVILCILSLGLDRLRSLKKERADGTIFPARDKSSVE